MRRTRDGQQAGLSRSGDVLNEQEETNRLFLRYNFIARDVMGISSNSGNRTISSKLKKMMLESNYSEVKGPCPGAESPNLTWN